MQVFIIAGVIALLLILTIVGILSRYKKCRSDEVLVVYGKTSGKASAKCYHGGAAFVWPVIQGHAIMSMRPMQIQCDLRNALSNQKIEVNVPTVVTVAISDKPEIMQNAAVRLLGLDENEKIDQIKDVIWGQMRLVIAEMSVEQLISDRDTFLGSCKQNISTELEKLGLTLININISDISDNADYIVNLGKKAAAEAKYRALADIEEKTKDGEVGIANQKKEKAISLAKIDKDRETEVAQNDRDKQTVVAETQKDRDITLRNTEKERNVGIAEREKDEAVRTREIAKDQEVETANLDKDEATQVANIEKEKSIEVATAKSEQAQKVAEQQKLKDVAIAQQQALTDSETAAANAERDAKIAKANAESRTAQQQATQDSDASIVEFQQQADARKETATQQAEAKKKAAEQEKESKVAEAKAATQKRTAIANKDAKLTENTAGIEVAKSDAKLGVERAEADKAIGESRANAEKAIGIANAQKEAEVAKALAEAEKAKQTADIMVGTEIEASRKKVEAEGLKQKVIIEANAEAEAIKMKAEAEAEAKRLVMKAEAEGRMAIASAIQAENAAKTAELQALLHAGMEGGQVVQIVLKDELEKIARADAEKFEHLHLGNVTVVGGADAAPSFLGKVVEAVSKVNGLKENIPGAGGLLGLLGAFDDKHQTTDTQEKAPETK
jgi:flotillin